VWLLEFDIGMSALRDDEAYEIAHDFPEWREIQAGASRYPMAMQRPPGIPDS